METLCFYNVCGCGDASVNNVLVEPAWGPEFRFPAPMKMLNAETCVSHASIGGGRRPAKTGRSWEPDSQAVCLNLELQVQWETLLQKNKVDVMGKITQCHPLVFACIPHPTPTHKCTLVFHEELSDKVPWIKTVFLLGCCSKVKK